MKVPKTLFNNRIPISGIYSITNIINNKQYIGSSIDMYNRLYQHRNKLRKNTHQNQYLQNSYNKYTESNFKITILEFCKKEELTNKEQFYIDSINSEFNITRIVERNILSKESRIKIRETLVRRYKNKEIISKSCKKIYVYDSNGNYLMEFNSLKECSQFLNIHPSSIIRVLSKIYKVAKTYQFSYIKLDNMDIIKMDSKGKAAKKGKKTVPSHSDMCRITQNMLETPEEDNQQG